MKNFFPFILFIVISFSSAAQNRDALAIKRLSDEILTHSTAYENLRFLCKKIGPRLSGSENAKKAVFATAEMLRKAGADTVYLQPCMVTHWIRGAKEEGNIVIGNKTYPLQLTAIGNTVGTGTKGVKASVVEVKDMSELAALGRKGIAGKIVFFNIAMNPTLIKTFLAYGANGAGRRSGPAQAAKYGAIGVMVRSLASNVDDYPHTGATNYSDSFPKIPAVAISTKNAEWLSETMSSGKIATAYFKTNCKMLPKALSYNVIGEIKGTEKPEDIITVGGHLDSWDLAEGANDDGSGCMQSIEIIRSFKALGMQPKRTVRAVLFMNEENGGGGAQAYLDSAVARKEHHIFALESDAGGFTPRGFSLDMAAGPTAKIQSWAALFLPYGVYDIEAGGSGSDIGPLKKIGTALAGFEPDSQRYFDIHHAATDVFERVSKRELDLGTVNMAALIWLVSQYGL